MKTYFGPIQLRAYQKKNPQPHATYKKQSHAYGWLLLFCMGLGLGTALAQTPGGIAAPDIWFEGQTSVDNSSAFTWDAVNNPFTIDEVFPLDGMGTPFGNPVGYSTGNPFYNYNGYMSVGRIDASNPGTAEIAGGIAPAGTTYSDMNIFFVLRQQRSINGQFFEQDSDFQIDINGGDAVWNFGGTTLTATSGGATNKIQLWNFAVEGPYQHRSTIN